MKRRAIRQLIHRHRPWYQDIHFGPLLDTGPSYKYYMRRFMGRKSRSDILWPHLPDLSGQRVIDVGCNAGRNSIEMSCRGASDVIGIEHNLHFLEQAHAVEQVFRATGRPVGRLTFQQGDIMRRLDLLQDRDVFVACCVLYHLGNLEPLVQAIAASKIATIVLQGNTHRCDVDRMRNSGKLPHDIAGIEGMTRFVEAAGFRVESVHGLRQRFPMVVARRMS